MRKIFLSALCLLFSELAVAAQTPQPTPLFCPAGAMVGRAKGQEASLVLTSPDTQGNLLSLRVPDVARPGKFVQVGFVNTGGHMVSPWSLTLSGHYTSGIGGDGVKYVFVQQASSVPVMLDMWGDTRGVFSAKPNKQPGAFNYQNLDSDGYTTLTIQGNGDLQWGMEKIEDADHWPQGDVRLGRTAPGVLAISNTLQVQRLQVGTVKFINGTGWPKGSCDNGTLYTQVDGDGRLFFCRAGSWMRVPLYRR